MPSKNRLDINWSKTFFMVITNKRLKAPESFKFDDLILVISPILVTASIANCFPLKESSIYQLQSKFNFLKHLSCPILIIVLHYLYTLIKPPYKGYVINTTYAYISLLNLILKTQNSSKFLGKVQQTLFEIFNNSKH